MDEEELSMGVEDMDAVEGVLITQLPPYVPPRKSTIKVTKDLDWTKYKVFMPLLPKEVPMEGDLLAQILFLKMEDTDLGDHVKFPQLEPKKYLKKVYYDESVVT